MDRLALFTERPLELNLNIRFPPDPRQEEILKAIGDLKDAVMTQLQDTIATLSADDTALAADVDALVKIIQTIPAQVQAAVATALSQANVDTATTTAALSAIDTVVKGSIAEAVAALPAPSGGGGGGGDTNTGSALALTTGSLADAVTGQDYSADLVFTGGTAPVTVTSVPPSDNGFTVNADGSVTGTGVADATSTFSVTGTDSATPPNVVTGSVTLVSATPPA
jgi:hypothetical protein